LWTIITIASLIVLIILALCVPVEMVLHTDVYGKAKFHMRLSWLFGLFSKEIAGGKKKTEGEKRDAKPKKKGGRRNIRFIFRMLQNKGLLKQFKGLVKDIFSCFKFRDMVADFKVGLGDPADTGLLFAFISPVSVFLGSSRFHRINLQPSFGDEAILEGYSWGTARLRPIKLVLPLLKFTFSSAAIRALKTLVLSKWKGKK